jgi:two-component system, OmpR family, phosphate regulon response regulator PhoB
MTARVLIVEDEAPLAELLRYNLEAEGFQVSHAESGEEAEILVAEERPDLVLLDWMLPQVSGIELCRRLRARPETRAIPIVMLTARGEEGDRIRGLSTGADDYVVKPFSLPELMARVKAILRRASPDRSPPAISHWTAQPIASREACGKFASGRPNSACSNF